jgi:hypothetical protein
MRRFLTLLAAALFAVTAGAQPVKLVKNSQATQLMLHGEPFIIIGGELANSSASSGEYMDSRDSWAQMRAAGLNTVLAPVYWELIEPQEGKFDFSSVDYLLSSARANDLHLVLLWFGTWKNSMSCYTPSWVKQGFGSRFTLAQSQDGDVQEIISAFCKESLKADCKAFAALMKHLRESDSEAGTVLMVQVENEIGLLGGAREFGKAAQKAWKKGKWKSDDIYTQERFQATYYARYAGAVAKAGKAEYNIPMYVNTALNSRGRKPGEYPAAGPLDHLMDIWKAEAPAIDLISPDIYDPGFPDWIAKYSRENNQLFIPEIRQSPDNCARVFYALGRHSALGFSPFSIDNDSAPIVKAYKLLDDFLPLIARKQAEGKVYGVLTDKDHPQAEIDVKGVHFTCRHDGTISWCPVHNSPENWGEGAFLIIDMDEEGLLFLGTACVATMTPSDGKGHVGILSIDEIADGSMHSLRRLNGDEDHQGRHLRIPFGEVGAQLLKTYKY